MGLVYVGMKLSLLHQALSSQTRSFPVECHLVLVCDSALNGQRTLESSPQHILPRMHRFGWNNAKHKCNLRLQRFPVAAKTPAHDKTPATPVPSTNPTPKPTRCYSCRTSASASMGPSCRLSRCSQHMTMPSIPLVLRPSPYAGASLSLVVPDSTDQTRFLYASRASLSVTRNGCTVCALLEPNRYRARAPTTALALGHGLKDVLLTSCTFRPRTAAGSPRSGRDWPCGAP